MKKKDHMVGEKYKILIVHQTDHIHHRPPPRLIKAKQIRIKKVNKIKVIRKWLRKNIKRIGNKNQLSPSKLER